MSETVTAVATPATRIEPRLDMTRDYENWVERHKTDATTAKAAATRAERERDAAAAERDAAKAEVATKLAEAETKADQRVIRAELKALAKAAGIVDPSDLALMDTSKLKLAANGDVEGAEDALAAFKKSKPQLFAATTSTAAVTPTGAQPELKNARDQTPEEYAANLRKIRQRG